MTLLAIGTQTGRARSVQRNRALHKGCCRALILEGCMSAIGWFGRAPAPPAIGRVGHRALAAGSPFQLQERTWRDHYGKTVQCLCRTCRCRLWQATMLTGRTWVAIQYHLARLPKGKPIEYGWAGRRPLCGGSGTVTQITSTARARKDVPIRLVITAIADYAAETTERCVARISSRLSW
jgi:hypothetical protein